MQLLQHQENDKSWFRPRHPFVTGLDLCITAVGLWFVFHTEAFVQFYFVVVVLMFGCSALHHWLPYQQWHYRLDRAMIQFMIAGTSLPYTNLVIVGDGVPWLVALWAWATLFALLKLCCGWFMYQGFYPTAVYAVTGMLAVTVMVPVTLSEYWALLFWFGVGLYGLQLFSYNRQWFDFYPACFGYRELQHIVLLGAVACHTLAIFLYL